MIYSWEKRDSINTTIVEYRKQVQEQKSQYILESDEVSGPSKSS